MYTTSKLSTWLFSHYTRRRGWLNDNLTFSKIRRMVNVGLDFLLKRTTLSAYPLILKIDISPHCHMACTICVHAKPQANNGPLNQQKFDGRMHEELFRAIVDEAKGKCLAISMYYMGDPYIHSKVDNFCKIAFDAGLNVHISTSFSFPFSDERIASIVESGVTHLTVCIDGATQDIYEITRVGGRLDWVISNLRRLSKYRKEHGRIYPKVEIQFISFPHNSHQLEEVRALSRELSADCFHTFEGYKDNWADRQVSSFLITGTKNTRTIPRCYWPYVLMLIKFNGDVIPCCLHRIGEQYTGKRPKHIVGNVFESGIAGVWNNDAYKAIRRVVSDPESTGRSGELESSFCHGCSAVSGTNEIEIIALNEAANYPRMLNTDVYR